MRPGVGRTIGTLERFRTVPGARPAYYRHVWGQKSRFAKGSWRLETVASIAESMTYSDSIERHTSGMPPRKAQIVPVKCTLEPSLLLITASWTAGSLDFRPRSSPEKTTNAPWATALPTLTNSIIGYQVGPLGGVSRGGTNCLRHNDHLLLFDESLARMILDELDCRRGVDRRGPFAFGTMPT